MQTIHLQATFDGEPDCVAHALFITQKKLKEENGGKDVLTDLDIFHQARSIIVAGKY